MQVIIHSTALEPVAREVNDGNMCTEERGERQ